MSLPPRPSRWARGTAAASAAAATWALYWVGSSRAFNYDAAVSVRNFIATPSVLDAVRKHVVFNNHPLLSLLDHLVYTATGSQGEMALRVVPVTVAAITVGLLQWLLSGRLGMLAATLGAALFAANPVFLGNVRDVRGYSLLALSAVGTTAVLVSPGARWRRTTYGLIGAVGVATHAYMVVVLGCQVLIAWRRGEALKRWWIVWSGLFLVAVLVNLPSFGSVGARGHLFRPGFPAQLGFELLGGNLVALALMVPVVVVAAAGARRSDTVLAGGAAVVLVIVGLWLWAPKDLYVRMFVWLAPLVGVCGAYAIARHRALGPVVMAATVAALVPQVTMLREPEIANRATAEFLAAAVRPGERVCGLGPSVQGMGPYRLRFHTVRRAPALGGCDIAFVLLPSLRPGLLRAARSRFPHECRLAAITPGLILSTRSLAGRQVGLGPCHRNSSRTRSVSALEGASG